MITFFKTIIYIPLYNVLIFLVNIPFIDAGVAAIILTLLVKFILLPLSKKAFLAQQKMKGVNEELSKIKDKYKSREEQAAKVMEFYKEKKINPFSGIFSMFIQIPVVISLYYIFLKSGLPQVDETLLYSFIMPPEHVSTSFLGLIDVSGKSVPLALLAAISSYFQMHFATIPSSRTTEDKPDFSKMLAKQMKYTFPFIVFFISWKISGVVAIYWFTSNIFTIAQDYFFRKSLTDSKEPQKSVNLITKSQV